MQTYSVRSGDTLSALAKRFGTSVSEIAKANNIANPNRINVGQKLVIPDGFEGPRRPNAPSKPADSFGGGAPQAAAGNGGPVRDSNGRQFPTSSDGTPMFKQGDAEWGSRTLGRSSSLSAAGCAMTATAMAVSKISGKTINPGQMDAWLDKNGGYSGNALIWGKAAQMGGLSASKAGWNLDTINKQVDAGRPVVIGVDYKAGSNGGSNGTDHWITITGRGKEGGKDVYYANDPATGKQITLSNQGGRLTGGPSGYKTTGELVVFSGGNPPRPGTAPANQGGGNAPANNAGGSGGTQAPARGAMSGMSLPAGDLERGARGAAVEQLQRALVKGGFMTQAEMNTGPGIFGPKTEAALKEFQAANGVDAIGRYGPKTRAAFEKLGAKVGGTGGAGPTGPVTGPTAPAGNGGGGVSLDQLRRIMPNLSAAKAQEYLPHLNNAMREAGITTRNQKAAFLAQLAHESGQFRYMEEIASGAAYEGRRDLGNTQPGDGVRFKGRGPIQLTGRANYTAAGKALGLDLVNNPRQAATPEVGFRTAAWFWNTRGLNALAEAGNFREVTRRINGGFNGLADRQMYYNRALSVLG